MVGACQEKYYEIPLITLFALFFDALSFLFSACCLGLTILIGVLGVMLAGTWLLLSPVRKV
jgi:hypothetical protein